MRSSRVLRLGVGFKPRTPPPSRPPRSPSSLNRLSEAKRAKPGKPGVFAPFADPNQADNQAEPHTVLIRF